MSPNQHYLKMKKLNQTKKMKSLRKSVIGIIATFAFVFTFLIAEAQNNLSITFRSATNFPTKDLGATKLRSGGGFETTIACNVMPHLEAYAGWGWNAFNGIKSTVDLQFV